MLGSRKQEQEQRALIFVSYAVCGEYIHKALMLFSGFAREDFHFTESPIFLKRKHDSKNLFSQP